jgi:hypothetical protein
MPHAEEEEKGAMWGEQATVYTDKSLRRQRKGITNSPIALDKQVQ